MTEQVRMIEYGLGYGDIHTQDRSCPYVPIRAHTCPPYVPTHTINIPFIPTCPYIVLVMGKIFLSPRAVPLHVKHTEVPPNHRLSRAVSRALGGETSTRTEAPVSTGATESSNKIGFGFGLGLG